MTLEEVLKNTGMSDDQIAAMDAKVKGAFTEVLSTASKSLEQAQKDKETAELTNRTWQQKLDTEINPALNQWGNEKAANETRIAAMEAALKSAVEGGFVIPDILKTVPPVQPRTGDGKFVAGTNSVPGSPGFEKKLTDELGSAFAFAADTQWKYRTLYGQEMPDSPTAIIKEATAQRMSPSEYAAKKYDFAGKEKAISEQRQKEHDESIRKAAVEERDKYWGEKAGSNPDMRRGQTSEFSEINKAVKAGTRPDPIRPGITEAVRDAGTREAIKAEIANQTVQ
jgi:hypothetical protein